MSKAYGHVELVPLTFIIDRQGNIGYHHIGYNDWSQPAVEAALRRLANQGVWEGWSDGKAVGEQVSTQR